MGKQKGLFCAENESVIKSWLLFQENDYAVQSTVDVMFMDIHVARTLCS